MAIEEEDDEVEARGVAFKKGGKTPKGGHDMSAPRKAPKKATASTDEDFDSWDEEETEEDEEDLAPTASIRRSRQAARRRATVAGLNFDIIARNKRSV